MLRLHLEMTTSKLGSTSPRSQSPARANRSFGSLETRLGSTHCWCRTPASSYLQRSITFRYKNSARIRVQDVARAVYNWSKPHIDIGAGGARVVECICTGLGSGQPSPSYFVRACMHACEWVCKHTCVCVCERVSVCVRVCM